jgi:voltage-gated potassium channel
MTPDDPTGEVDSLSRLPPSKRRRIVATAFLRIADTTVLVVAVYFLVPMDRSFGPDSVIGLGLGLLAVFAVVGWQVWQITRSDHPTLRAVEALALIIPLYVLLFAAVYFLMDHANKSTFGGPLSRIDAMYFSATVFTTVGFGDITAKTEAARVIVTVQMMLDLAIIGLVVRLVINAVKIGQRRSTPTA